MNGNLFHELQNLRTVYLRGNECIDESFTDLNDSNSESTFAEIIAEKCGFCETDKPIEIEVCTASFQGFDDETLMNETLKENEICRLQIALKTHEISRLNDELLAQKNETEEIEKLRQAIHFIRLQYNELLTQFQDKINEVYEKDLNIQSLKKEIRLLNNDV